VRDMRGTAQGCSLYQVKFNRNVTRIQSFLSLLNTRESETAFTNITYRYMTIVYMQGADCYIALGRDIAKGIIYQGVSHNRLEAIRKALLDYTNKI
jgi:hypothetical protein